MIHGSHIRRNHVGRALVGGFGDDANAEEYFSDNTRRLDDAALWSKVSDVLEGSVNEAKFQALVAKAQALTNVGLPGTVQETVEVTARDYGFSKAEADSILRHFIEDGDLSAWGLVNAVTRTAQDSDSYDRAVEIETIGGAMFAEYSRN